VKVTIVEKGKITFGEPPTPQKIPIPPPKKLPLPKKEAPPVAKAPPSKEVPSPDEFKVDNHVEVTGTVLSADGQIAISSSSLTSPALGLNGLLGSSLGSLMGLAFSDLSEKRKPKSEEKNAKKDKGKSANGTVDFIDGMQIKDIMIRFHDGRKVRGRIVGVDRKNDVTFLRPAKELTKLPYLSLTDGAARLDILDDVIVLYPLSKALKRRIAVSNQRIAAAADKKGSIPVLDLPAMDAMLGCPAFDADGRPIGIVTASTPPTTSDALLDRGDIEGVILGPGQIQAALKRLGKN
jgi:hypothetical protein